MEALSPNRNRAGLVARTAPARAKASNRETYLPGVDGRSVAARRFHDITVSILSDQGGADHVSEARLHLVRRLSAITAMIEQLEAKYLAGETIDHELHLSMVNTATRLSNTIGLNRRAKKVPSLDEIEAEYQARNGRTGRVRLIEHDDGEDEDD